MFWLFIFLSLSASKRMPDRRGQQRVRQPTGDSVPQEASAEEENLELMYQWDQVMQGFVPEDMITFEIPARGEQEFFEVVDSTPTTLRGAWFLASGDSKDIDFAIYDHTQTIIFERKSKKEAIFEVEAPIGGMYVFKFTNTKVMQGHTITFTFNSGKPSEILQASHLTPVEESLVAVKKSIQDFQVDNQFSQLRQETHYKTVASANRNVFWFSLVESIGVLGVTAWQIYYIKKLLDNRRVL